MSHTPLQIMDAAVTLGDVEHGDAITACTIVPNIVRTDWQPVSGNDQTVYADPTWLLNIDLGQNYETSSLLVALISGHGEVVPFSVKPKTGGNAEISGEVRLVMPSQLLGPRSGIATAQASLAVQGQPTIIDDSGTTVWPKADEAPGGEV